MNREKGAVILIIALVLLLPQLSSSEVGSCEVVNSPDIRIMTFNIRRSSFFDVHDSWEKRSSAVVSMICRESPDVIGLQEVTPLVMEELKHKLYPSYASYGVGRDNGSDVGEHNPIFFNREKLTVLDQGTFWLAPLAPAIPSYGWSGKRIVTWVKLQYRESGKEFFLFNTHFDNKSEEAKRESAILLFEQIQKIAGEHPIILAGDINAVPESESYAVLTDPNIDGANLVDSRLASAGFGEVTYSGFDPLSHENGSIVDYILVDGSFKVLEYDVLQDTVNNRFLSDHRPVMVTVEFKKGEP